MNLFKEDKFYVIVDKGENPLTFVTFGTTGGFRKCDTLSEASKFKGLSQAKTAVCNRENLKVFSVELIQHVVFDKESKPVFAETWAWTEVE